MKTKSDIIIMIRFCFTNLDVGYSKMNCPAARSEQALVISHSCTSELCPPYSQQEPSQPPSAAAQGALALSRECLKGYGMGKSGGLLCFPLLWGLLGLSWEMKGQKGGRAEPKPGRVSGWEVEADPREAGTGNCRALLSSGWPQGLGMIVW